jgi:hypothetical protein
MLDRLPFRNIARLTAGLTCPPLKSPIKKMTKASVKPMTRALPVTKMLIKSKKVPKNSAINDM